MCLSNWMHWISRSTVFGQITRVNSSPTIVDHSTIYVIFLFIFRLDVKTIYILMRPKRTKSCADRLDDILREPIFDQVLNKFPNSRDRIRIVNGTLAALHLELVDGNALDDLIESIEIVIHSAANVSFVADIYDVIATNLYGTQQLLELCKRMPLLKVFLYVSTAFCQLHHGEPIEQFYKPIIDPLLLIDWYHRMKANQSDRTEFEVVAEKLMSDAQMTPYTLSKNATEALIQSYGKWLPLAVVRPSIGKLWTKVFSLFRINFHCFVHGSGLYSSRSDSRMDSWHSIDKFRWRWHNERSDSHDALRTCEIECDIRRYGHKWIVGGDLVHGCRIRTTMRNNATKSLSSDESK